jgi:SNF2 family DNA or RNA helicase
MRVLQSEHSPCTLHICLSPCRLLLRNHEALSALEASVTTSSSGSKQIVGEGNAWRRLLNLIMQLRKVVNHPFMLPDSEPRGEGTSSLQELLEASGELQPIQYVQCAVHYNCWRGADA